MLIGPKFPALVLVITVARLGLVVPTITLPEIVTQRGGRDRVGSDTRQGDRESSAVALARRLADGECGEVIEDARSSRREGVVDGARPAGGQRRRPGNSATR